MKCPNKEECKISVKDGKAWCDTHNKFLKITDNWDDAQETIPMKHILYTATSTSIPGEILIDEEQ